MAKQKCKTLEECHENFEYNGKYDFLDHGYIRLFGYCSECDRRGFEIFEYQDYEFEKAEKESLNAETRIKD